MIGVIADDLTGAAELGAVGLRCGLQAELVVAGRPSGQADLVCFDTDSRSCAPAEAGRRAASAANLLVESGADWIYKKVDSVLRGHVTTELEAIMNQLRLKLALLAPANPSLGRVIRHGRYFVRDRPLHETEFARDPEYPRRSSVVLELLAGSNTSPVRLCRVEDSIPAAGIVVGEVETATDLQYWSARRHVDLLPAGGAEFFGALLAAAGHAGPSARAGLAIPALPGELFVCGSTSESSRDFVRAARDGGTPVFSLPENLVRGDPFTPGLTEAIARGAVAAFQSHRRVILNVGLPPVRDRALARLLAVYLVQVAERVLRQAPVGHVYAEGGATAVELVRRMGWERLRVLREMAPGVATLSVGDARAMRLTIKPGSYLWPQ